jgi:NhaP-type Na+/H+ or K+/H+ antiporter
MITSFTKPSPAQITIKRYKAYGLVGGAAFGVLIGLLLSGPRFYEWPLLLTLAVIAACTIVGVLMGWGFMAVFVGALAGQAAAEDEISEGDGDTLAVNAGEAVDAN